MIDEVHVDNEERAFREIKNAIINLHNDGYKKLDIKTEKDKNGNIVITIVPREMQTEEESEK